MDAHQVSIIIPTLNEAEHIECLLLRLQDAASDLICEILVVDGGSTDRTCELARKFNGVLVIEYAADAERCRATQMNFSAARAKGNVLWFVHADCLPPADYAQRLCVALTGGCKLGGFAFEFDASGWLLRINSWFTRFNWSFTRGGDQTLLIDRCLFDALNGYDPSFVIMEEYDLIDRARTNGVAYQRLKGTVLVSARKYHSNSWIRVQLANLTAFRNYRRGRSPQLIRDAYFKQLRHPKADE